MLLKRDVYFGFMKLLGEEHAHTLLTAGNYAISLGELRRYAEAKSLLRKQIPVARRVLGENHEQTLRMRGCYAVVLYKSCATLEDLREAVTTLEDTERSMRRVLGGAYPMTGMVEKALADLRAALRARKTPSSSP